MSDSQQAPQAPPSAPAAPAAPAAPPAPQELRKSILIVKSQTKTLSSVETFLKNRDWHIQSTTEIKDALTYIIKHKPSFVMISMDHPNKKVRQMPKLLASAFPVYVIAFSESNTTQAYKNLLDSGCNYRINPPVTGPAVERTINKIIKDKETAEEEAKKQNQAARDEIQGANGTGNAVLKGEKGGDSHGSDSISVSGSGKSGHGPAYMGGSGHGHQQGPAYMGGSGGHQSEQGAAYLGNSGTNPDGTPAPIYGAGAEGSGDIVARSGEAPSFNINSAKNILREMHDGEEAHDVDLDEAILTSEAEALGGGAKGGGPAILRSSNDVAGHHDDEDHSAPDALTATAADHHDETSDGESTGGGFAHGKKKKKGASGPSVLGGSSAEEETSSRDGGPAKAGAVGGGFAKSGKGKESGPAYMGGESSGEGGPGVIIAKGEKSKVHSAVSEGAGMGDHHQSGEGSGSQASGPTFTGDGMIGKAHDAPTMEKGKVPDSIGRKHHNPSAKPEAQYSEEDIGDGGNAGPTPIVDASRVKPGGAAAPLNQGGKSTDSAAAPGAPAKMGGADTIKVGSKVSGWQKQENIIVKGAHKALEDSVDIRDGKIEHKVEQASNVACIVVESARFSGYLVAAMGKNHKVDAKFIKVIKDRLYKFLESAGEKVNQDEQMGIKIKQVDFEDWALEYADFLRKSVHEGQEIAMAFFPFAEAKTQVQDSASADMGAVKIEDIQGDQQVDFNVYIYMPTNKKYVLYTPRGSKFYGNQKDRLMTMGVTQLHVKRTELMDVSKYRAQNYLNSKIEEFENKKKASKSKTA